MYISHSCSTIILLSYYTELALSNSRQGHYLYIPTPENSGYQYADLISTDMVPTMGTACLSFWYYLGGSRVGELSVYMTQGIDGTHDIYDGTKTYAMWEMGYNPTNSWQNAQVNLFNNVTGRKRLYFCLHHQSENPKVPQGYLVSTSYPYMPSKESC